MCTQRPTRVWKPDPAQTGFVYYWENSPGALNLYCCWAFSWPSPTPTAPLPLTILPFMEELLNTHSQEGSLSYKTFFHLSSGNHQVPVCIVGWVHVILLSLPH